MTGNSQGILHLDQKAETKHKMWKIENAYF